MIKMVLFDVDGTLVSFQTHKIKDSSKKAIKALQDKGIKCVLCTGRHIDVLKKMAIKDIPFDAYITLNGQICYDKDLNVLYRSPFNNEIREALVKIFNQKEIPLLFVEENDSYLNKVDQNVINTYDHLENDMPPVKEYSGNDIYLCIPFLDPNTDFDILSILPKGLKCVCWFHGSADIIKDSEGKVDGIKQILKHFNLNREETLAIGDGNNDVEMIKYASIGIAMGNSHDCLKEVADYITADIEDDGVYKALKHFGLI